MTPTPPHRFIGYPTDHMLAAFRDPGDAAAAAAALRAAGLHDRDISILRGEEGARRLDGTGSRNGLAARAQRLMSFTLMDQMPDLAWYEAAVRGGGAVVMVRVRGDEQRAASLAALQATGGHFLNYYGRFATEEVSRWAGPEPDLDDLLKR